MNTVHVKGRFISSDMSPMSGQISFYPTCPVVDEHAPVWFASVTVTQKLKRGKFDCEVVPGRYRVISPVGTWVVDVPDSDKPVYLSQLAPTQLK